MSTLTENENKLDAEIQETGDLFTMDENDSVENVATYQVYAILHVASALNNVSRAIREAYGVSTEGPAFLEKLAMVIDDK